jgi:inorganic triphosphatase YgiF
MTQKAEIEIKLEPKNTDIRTIVGTLESSSLLRSTVAQAQSKELVSVYFDTRELKLRKHGVSLRVRHFDDHHVQTIKRDGPGAGAALTRDEWECEVEDGTPDLGAARGTALEPLLSRKVRSSLKPLFETRVQRTVYPINLDGSDIELSIDKGHVEDGRQSSDFCEVELELIHGDGARLFRLARQLANRIPLEICVRSKAERGYALITGESPQPVKSPPANLNPRLKTQVAFQAIARGCLHHLIANMAALRAGAPTKGPAFVISARASADLPSSLLLAEYLRQQTTIRALQQEIKAQVARVTALKASLALQAEEARRQRQIKQAQEEQVAALEQRLGSIEGMLSRPGAHKAPQRGFAED